MGNKWEAPLPPDPPDPQPCAFEEPDKKEPNPDDDEQEEA